MLTHAMALITRNIIMLMIAIVRVNGMRVQINDCAVSDAYILMCPVNA